MKAAGLLVSYPVMGGPCGLVDSCVPWPSRGLRAAVALVPNCNILNHAIVVLYVCSWLCEPVLAEALTCLGGMVSMHVCPHTRCVLFVVLKTGIRLVGSWLWHTHLLVGGLFSFAVHAASPCCLLVLQCPMQVGAAQQAQKTVGRCCGCGPGLMCCSWSPGRLMWHHVA